MAKEIKAAAKFSEDALEMALNEMSEEKRMSFQLGLEFIQSKLGKKDKNTKTGIKKQKLSDETMFKSYILPDINRRLQEIENAEVDGHLKLNVNLNFMTSFTLFNFDELMKEHERIVAMEEGLKSFILFAQYSRGLLYMEIVQRLKREKKNVKEFVEKTMGLAYMTALRYITLTSFVLTYPRIILCQMSFTQLLKHKTRLIDFLMSEGGQELGSRLALSVEIVAQGQRIKFSRIDMSTLDMKFSTDPDWKYQDINTEVDVSSESLYAAVESGEVENEEAELNNVMSKLCVEK